MTFRGLSPLDVVIISETAGLECIEWGADTHAPHDAPLPRIAAMTREHGLHVASYGSYFRGEADDNELEATIAAAVTLGAPRIRIWAGDSEEPDPSTRDRLIRRIRDFVVVARAEGIVVGLEFHEGTLAHSADTAVRVLDDVGEGLQTYWQPRVGAAWREALADLRQLMPRLCGAHAFSWTATGERLPLARRPELWQDALALIAERTVDTDVLLEFVAGDSPAQLMEDAATLRALATGLNI